jgi:hypothetical protein
VKGTIPSSLAIRKEWVAALAWLTDHNPPSTMDCRQLSDGKRKVLAALLAIDGGKVGLAGRITSVLSATGTSDNELMSDDSTFLSLIQSRGFDQAIGISTLTRQAALTRIGDSPFSVDIGNVDLQALRERCAMQLWISQVRDSSGLADLPPRLRVALGQAVGISGASDEKLLQLLTIVFDISSSAVPEGDPGWDRVVPGWDRVVQLVKRPTCDRLIAGSIPTGDGT